MCGRTGEKLFFNLLTVHVEPNKPFPKGFVPLSQFSSSEFTEDIRGAFPLCIQCVSPCPKCEQAEPSEKLLNFARQQKAQVTGLCDHIKWGFFIKALLMKAFRLGRFAQK
jgi:hypothetical protein